MSELIPWVDATFSTIAEFSGRAVSGSSPWEVSGP